MTDHTYACNDLTNFEYAVHAIAGNGSYLNWQKLEKLVKSLCEYLFLAGFCVLEPLWCGGFVFLNAAYPLCCNDALALAGLSSVLPTHPLHPFILHPRFLQFLEIWFEKSGSRKEIDQKKRWFYTINPREIWFDKSG